MHLPLKEFEEKQLDWWCNHYRTALTDLSFRARQYLNGEIEEGMLEVFLRAIEEEMAERENLV